MEHCETREELAIQYVMALDQAASARRDARMAVTQTQMECAGILLGRVEAHRLSMLRDLTSHVESHSCATTEIQALLTSNQAMAVAG